MSRVDEFFEGMKKEDSFETFADKLMDDLNSAFDKFEEYKRIQKKEVDAQSVADHLNAFAEMYYPMYNSKITSEDVINIFNLSDGIYQLRDAAPEEIKKKEEDLLDMVAKMGW